ncbi:hypothetical protein Baya_0887 [Bagarius yarrelli]|uniref:Uncharacterized protein n=1 Tax=Bagarius yarrelli TaxID=175774 RepID=A0A556TJJ0_BAGYA|nr:hypothetical protein Baya_0887 [Bagarius yarrelli]
MQVGSPGSDALEDIMVRVTSNRQCPLCHARLEIPEGTTTLCPLTAWTQRPNPDLDDLQGRAGETRVGRITKYVCIVLCVCKGGDRSGHLPMRARGFSGSDCRLRHILTKQVLHEMRRWVSEIQEQVLFIGSRAGAKTPEHTKRRARTTSPYTRTLIHAHAHVPAY